MNLFKRITEQNIKPINAKYSPELKSLVAEMIQKNKESRCYIEKVITLSKQMLQVLK